MPDLLHPAVKEYLARLRTPDDSLMREVRERSLADKVPAMSPDTLCALQALASLLPARRVFEIGTGYGLSGLAVARAGAPDCQMLTVERDAARAAVAREHFDRAGLGTRAHVMVGEGTRLVHKVLGPFDLIVQDGEKSCYGPLLDRLVSLLRPGGVLVSDNILWSGDVVPGFSDSPIHRPESIEAITRYNERLAAEPRLRTAFLPVGDGIAISVRTEGTS
jgi:predicted O-methyltransferase YrrM